MSAALALAEFSAKGDCFTQNLPRPQSLAQLRQELGNKLLSVDQLRPPEGLPTGISTFDNFLLWKGIPKGEISLLYGHPGTGCTSLWLSTARQIHAQKKWVAWVNSDWELLPSHLVQKGLDLNRLLVVQKPTDKSQMFYILQELITSSLFEMVGCHLQLMDLKIHQLNKLKKLASLHKVALVIISSTRRLRNHPLFSLIIDFQKDFLTVRRALHRPTPFHIARDRSETQLNYTGRNIYENFMRELTMPNDGSKLR
jgi:recombination protein RecA